VCSVRANSHQLLNLLQRKTQTLHSLHKAQPLDGIGIVKAKAACAAGGPWQQLASLVEPDGIDTEISALCEFANLKGGLPAVVNARHDIKDTLWSAVQSQEEKNQRLDMAPYFCKYRNMSAVQTKKAIEKIAKYADMFSAMGTEPRLRIMQLLLSAHPHGLVVGEIQEELDIPNSTLSHHLDKLKAEDLVHVERESTFLHYTANSETLRELLQFLYAECCTRNKAVKPDQIIQICK